MSVATLPWSRIRLDAAVDRTAMSLDAGAKARPAGHLAGLGMDGRRRRRGREYGQSDGLQDARPRTWNEPVSARSSTANLGTPLAGSGSAQATRRSRRRRFPCHNRARHVYPHKRRRRRSLIVSFLRRGAGRMDGPAGNCRPDVSQTARAMRPELPIPFLSTLACGVVRLLRSTRTGGRSCLPAWPRGCCRWPLR